MPPVVVSNGRNVLPKRASPASLQTDIFIATELAALNWNGWPLSIGIAGRFKLESVAALRRNMQLYRPILGLPLSMALIASYVQKEIPAHHIYIGEIDLLRQVRQVPEDLVNDLFDAIDRDEIRKPVRLFLPTESANLMREVTSGVTVVACKRLEDAVFNTWPELKREES